ncbi:MAG: DUF4838 domain-containing protein [Clostridia bacterium]|nr:DUF4838 domain-containing protein [Clostridia bacterium]
MKKSLLFVVSALALISTVGAFRVYDTNVTKAENAVSFEMDYGASIRGNEPTGIRFKTKMNDAYYNEIKGGSASMYVMLIPYSYYQEYETSGTTDAVYTWLTNKYGTSNIVNLAVPAAKIYKETDGYYYANAVISNVLFNNYHLDFVGVAYLKRGSAYEDVANITQEDNARSIFKVACKAAEDEEDYAKFADFLDLTIEKGLYRAYGVRYDNVTLGYEYATTQYASYEEMKTALGLDLDQTTVSISSDSFTMGVGEQKQLGVNLLYSDNTVFTKDACYTYESSDQNVVTVDENGNLSAVAAGEATITVKALGGKYLKEDTCTVSVGRAQVDTGYEFFVKGDAGVWVANTGNAVIDLTDTGIDGTQITKVLCGENEVTVAATTATSVTLTDAPAGDQEYTIQTETTDYSVKGCIYNHAISTADELNNYRKKFYLGYCVLTADIDFQGVTLEDLSSVAENLKNKSCILDGRGHTVSNFTYTTGFVENITATGGIKNVKFFNVTQDCTNLMVENGGGTDVHIIYNGLFGKEMAGTIENVEVRGTIENVPNVSDTNKTRHWAILAYKVTGTMKNIVATMTSDGGRYDYALGVGGLTGTVDNVYMVYTNTGSGGVITNKTNVTNTGLYTTQEALLAAKDFSSWTEIENAYWLLDEVGMPYIGLPVAQQKVDGLFLAQGDAALTEQNANTGNATLDLSAADVDLSGATKVLCGTTSVTIAAKTEKTITLTNAPAGDQIYTIYTPTHAYSIMACVYSVGISTADDFIAWRNMDTASDGKRSCWKYAVLLNNVDMEGAVLSKSVATYMMGVLDGRGYTLSNFTLNNCSLFQQGHAYATIKNIHIKNVTLDCSGYTGNVNSGIFAQAFAGTLENILLEGTIANLTQNVIGVLCYGATGTVKNVATIINTSGTTKQHRVLGWNTSTTATIDNVYAAINSSSIYFCPEATQATNSGVYADKATMLAAKDFTTWNGTAYWANTAEELKMTPWTGVWAEETPDDGEEGETYERVTVSEIQYLSDDNGTITINLKNSHTIDLSNTQSVTYNGAEWPNGFTVTDGALAISGVVRGNEYTFEITTDTHVYTVTVYVVAAYRISGDFEAQGDAVLTEANANTGNATIDLSGTGVANKTITKVLYGDTAVSFTQNGASLTLVNAPAGENEYTLVTSTANYIIEILIYNQVISTADEFKAWRNSDSWKYAILANDIDLEGATLEASSASWLRGVLDGRGYTVANFNLNATSLVGHIYTLGGFKNIQFVNATQTYGAALLNSAGTAINRGFLAQTNNGIIENVLLRGSLTGIPEGMAHWGVLCYNTGNATYARIKNVIVDITSDGTGVHMVANSTGNVAEFDNVYLVCETSGSYKVTDLAAATNTAVYATEEKFIIAEPYAAWGEPWVIETGKRPYMTDYTQYLEETTMFIENGQTDYVVVMDSSAYDYWQSYSELNTLLLEAGITYAGETEITRGIGRANDAETLPYTELTKYVSIGNTYLLEKAGVTVDYGALGEFGYQIITKDSSIFICANSNEGLVYGAYELLHQLLGFETYTSTYYYIDKNADVALSTIDILHVPDIDYRVPVSGELMQYNSATNLARNRMRLQNTGDVLIDGGQAHNMTSTIVPSTEWLASKPNWFYVKDGEVKQLCYTAHGNTSDYDAMVAEAADNVKTLIAADTTANLFSLTQMDTKNWCDCDTCAALKTTYGTDAAGQIRFINDVTDIVNAWLESDCGGREVQFATFAYYSTETAPATKNADGTWTAIDETIILNDNVSIWLAPIAENYNDASSNTNIAAALDAWGACAKSCFIWAYSVYFNNYMIPYDSYDQIQGLVQTAVAHNAKFFWAQGNYNTNQNSGFDDLKNYLFAKLTWDSTLDVDTLIDNYFNAVYGGTAATQMKAAFENWRLVSKNSDLSGNIYYAPTSWWDITTNYSTTFLTNQLGYMEEAIKALDTSDEDYQLRYDSIMCETICWRYIYKEKVGTEYESSVWTTTLEEDISRLGFTMKSEGEAF